MMTTIGIGLLPECQADMQVRRVGLSPNLRNETATRAGAVSYNSMRLPWGSPSSTEGETNEKDSSNSRAA